MTRRNRKPLGIAALLPLMVVGAALALSGCAVDDADAAPAPIRSSSAPPETTSATPEPPMTWPGDPVSGQGAIEHTETEFAVPEGAHSLVVDFECTGGASFSAELATTSSLVRAPLRGTCEGASQLAWPIVERNRTTFRVQLPDGVAWTARPTFSSADFDFDEAVTADCEKFAAVYSELVNADTGFTFSKKIDAADWVVRVDRAAADLQALAAYAKSTLGASFSQLQTIVSDPARTTGDILTPSAGPIGDISKACSLNQTPLILTGEFGG
ncbi:hypothetical protein AB1K54_06515 [Microbacterium sp. BWT-B31]|uniref:hypothetical protein n=1 Tax=Microbacterium sp. BWT-B31 TaxID=3232072 RepID=UPI003528D5AD